MGGVVDKPPMPAALRLALLAVLLGIVLSAVTGGLAIGLKWDFAARHPSDDWRSDPGNAAFFTTVVVIVAWGAGTAAATLTAILAAARQRAGQIALTAVLALCFAYGCAASYNSADVWERVGSGTTDRDFVDRNGFLPYLGALGLVVDLTLVALALAPMVLLWLPATQRFYARGVAG